jgi:hypothetical protein
MHLRIPLTRAIGPLIGIGLTVLLLAPSAAGAQDVSPSTGCLATSLVEQDNSAIRGQAHLCRDGSGIEADADVTNLAPGSVYTMWFVYFDKPTDCQTIPCQPVDTTGDNPPGVLARMDGLIASNTGEAHFSGQVHGLRLSPGSEFHLPVFTHGPANTDDNRALARQLLTPQVPGLGTPGLGVGADGRLGFLKAAAMFDIP